MKAWEDFILRLEQDLGVETVKKWLRSLKVIRYDACNLYLEAKDSFQVLWFEEHIRNRVISSFVNNNHKKIRVHLTIVNRASNKAVNVSPAPKVKAPTLPFQLTFDQVDPLCTFENFVLQETNTVPFRLLTEEIHAFNPIYLYGDSGAGKSHLLMSALCEQQKAGKKALYVRAETFTDHVVSAIRNGEMRQFRDAYRNADFLLVDDVHLFSRKGATQEEFFHTFNTLHLAGKQMIISAKCPPVELQEIEPRLISRFEWGIVLPLTSAKGQDIYPLLLQKAKALDYPLPPKVAEFLIESFSSTSKAVIRALEALILRSHIQQDTRIIFRPMTAQLARHYLADLLLAEKQHALSPEKIIQWCSDHYGIRPEDILSKAQTRECVQPRQIAMYLCRKKLKLPFAKIGEIFGRDHSTVMSSIKLIHKGIEARENECQAVLAAIEKKIGR